MVYACALDISRLLVTAEGDDEQVDAAQPRSIRKAGGRWWHVASVLL